MEEQIISNEQTADQAAQPPKRGRYGLWIRVTALFLVVAMLLGIMTNVDFSLLRYQGTDQMVAAEYLMDTTPYLGSSRIQRLKSLLTSVDAFSINLQAAEIAIGKTDYDRAAKFLNKCIPLSPDELQKAELYNRLGCVYMLAEDSAQAQQAFDSSIGINPEEPTPYLLRAQLRYQNGDASGAAEDADAYLNLGGQDREMLSTAASICELGGNLENAVEAFSRMLRGEAEASEKALAYAERGRVKYLLGQNEGAVDDINRARQLDESVLTGVHYAIVGLYAYDTGDYANSREDFLKAARLSEDGNAEYYEQAILCGYLSEDFDFIRQTIAEARKKNMMTANSLLIEGILLFSEERYEDAEAALSECLDKGTIVTGVYYYRALSRMALGNFEQAAEDFTEALNWEENKNECIFNRGVCYYAMEDFEKATADLQFIAEESGDEALALSAEELLATLK